VAIGNGLKGSIEHT